MCVFAGIMRIVALIMFALACASAWMMTARPASQALKQCPAPVQAPKFAMLLDDELDNPNIAEDEKIEPARKCGFCMG